MNHLLCPFLGLWQCRCVQEEADDTFRSQGALSCCMALKNCSQYASPSHPHPSWTSVSEFRLNAIWMSQITNKTLKPNFLKPTRALFHVIRIHLLAQGPRQGHPRPQLSQRTLFESFKEILFLPKQIGKEWDPAVRAADQVFVKLFNKPTIV